MPPQASWVSTHSDWLAWFSSIFGLGLKKHTPCAAILFFSNSSQIFVVNMVLFSVGNFLKSMTPAGINQNLSKAPHTFEFLERIWFRGFVEVSRNTNSFPTKHYGRNVSFQTNHFYNWKTKHLYSTSTLMRLKLNACLSKSFPLQTDKLYFFPAPNWLVLIFFLGKGKMEQNRLIFFMSTEHWAFAGLISFPPFPG